MRLIKFIGIVLIGFCFTACGNSNEDTAKTTNSASNVNQTTNEDSNATAQNTLNSNATAMASESSTTSKTPQDLYKKCTACHGDRGDKVAPGSVGNVHIANLDKSEIIKALKGYRAKNFSKGGTFAIMYLQAQDLSDDDINTLADYISSFNNK